MGEVRILVIDDDAATQNALRHVLDSEGWKVTCAPMVREGLVTLATGDWSLVICNIAMVGLESALFTTLRDLEQGSEQAGAKGRVRVMFLVPETAAPLARPVLQRDSLPFVVKPFHLNDFLERVGELLLEVGALGGAIRQVRRGGADRRRRERRSGFDRRAAPMFASRKEYFLSEEDLAAYEQAEAEERKRREKEEKTEKSNLGGKLED